MTDQEFYAKLPSLANAALEKWQVPSFGLGIVKDGEVVFCDGFGKRDIENNLDANGKTLYQIGSCSKAFTAAVCARLVDDGLLAWDEPIRTYVENVKLYDDFLTKECTLRDLLSHRTGLPRHEYGWYNTGFTREQIIQNMKYYDPSQPIRTKFQYCNYGFILAGYICEQVTGKTWEQMLDEYIFEPCGMSRSNAYIDSIELDDNHATPYGRGKNSEKPLTGMEKIPFYRMPVEDRSKGIGAPLGPAGSINSTAEDMLKWVSLHLNNGKVGETQVISEASINEMRKPQMLRVDALDIPNEFTEFMSYGLGWFVEMYRGHKYVQHGGNINGFSAYTAFVPDLNLGVVCYTNMNGNFVHFAMGRTIIDHYLGIDDSNWVDRYYDFCVARASSTSNIAELLAGKKVEDTTPSHPLSDFAGTYQRGGYEDIQVEVENEQLVLTFNSKKCCLDHYHYDTFVVGKNSDILPAGYPFSFEKSNMGGQVVSVSAPLVTEPGGNPVVFKKIK